jgi:hypothetical protein
LAAAASIVLLPSASSAQQRGTPTDYFCGLDHVLHRTPKGVLEGLPQTHRPCNDQQPVVTKPNYSLAAPAQVMAALDCDFSSAAQATKGKTNNISKAVITGTIRFSLVTKDSKGFNLSVAAIPVFVGGSLAPSLNASSLLQTTSSDKYSISVDPGALTECKTPSTDKWLTSKVLFGEGQIRVDQLKTTVEFVVTRQAGAGLKLNIVPVAIGPQFSKDRVNTQSLSLTFDFKKKTENQLAKAEPASVPAPPASSASK